jgi:hypothetical protein
MYDFFAPNKLIFMNLCTLITQAYLQRNHNDYADCSFFITFGQLWIIIGNDNS